MDKTEDKTPNAQRLARFRARVEKQGLVRFEVLCHPDDREVIREYAARLTRRRTPAAQEQQS